MWSDCYQKSLMEILWFIKINNEMKVEINPVEIPRFIPEYGLLFLT